MTDDDHRTDLKDRGASLVEFALLLPLLVLLLLGTITGGLAMSRQNSVKNAVREATRYSAVLDDFDDTTSNLNAMYAQVVAGATGDLDVGVDGREICVALVDDDNTWDYHVYGTTATPTAGSDTAGAGPATCTTGFDATVAADTQRVWVRARRTSKINAVLYSADWKLDAHALTRYER